MKFILKIFLGFGMLLLSQTAHSQLPRNKYVIFTFEYTYIISPNNISPHGTQTYYWIQPVDSIGKGSVSLKKLLISNYSTSELQDCCSGKAMNPYAGVVSPGSGSYNFDKSHYSMLDSIERMIKKHRRKVQSVHTTQKQGQQENIKVFATPISGLFCMSNFLNLGLHGQDYNSKIYIPYSSFYFAKNFWLSEIGKVVLATDYSKFSFSALPADK